MENNPATQKTELRRRPTAAQLRLELERESKKRKFPRFLKVLLFLLVVVLIAAITFFCLLSGYVVYGDSMMPTLQEGDLVLAIPNAQTQPGDLVAFRHDERILIKRAVGAPGDQIEVSDNGTVRINGVDLSEPYAQFAAGAANDITYPFQVSDGSWFVLGDNRGSSVDSRSRILGTIDNRQMLGKIFIRVWPLTRFEVFDPDFFQEFIATLKR